MPEEAQGPSNSHSICSSLITDPWSLGLKATLVPHCCNPHHLTCTPSRSPDLPNIAAWVSGHIAVQGPQPTLHTLRDLPSCSDLASGREERSGHSPSWLWVKKVHPVDQGGTEGSCSDWCLSLCSIPPLPTEDKLSKISHVSLWASTEQSAWHPPAICGH